MLTTQTNIKIISRYRVRNLGLSAIPFSGSIPGDKWNISTWGLNILRLFPNPLLPRSLQKDGWCIHEYIGVVLKLNFLSWYRIPDSFMSIINYLYQYVTIKFNSLFWQLALTHRDDTDQPSSYRLPLPNHQYTTSDHIPCPCCLRRIVLRVSMWWW